MPMLLSGNNAKESAWMKLPHILLGFAARIRYLECQRGGDWAAWKGWLGNFMSGFPSKVESWRET